MFNRVKLKILQILKQSPVLVSPAEGQKNTTFFDDPSLGVKRRYYESYEEYLRHQAEKLNRNMDNIKRSDQEYEGLIASRYESRVDFRGRSILCLGARLGGEVRAFKSLGALAIGIDIEPGPGNCHVLHGDFHNVSFPDNTFDFAFTNAIDHVFDLANFISEVARLLKKDGCFFIELAHVKPSNYEVLDTSELAPILAPFLHHFEIVASENILNKTDYINWKGTLLQMKKKTC